MGLTICPERQRILDADGNVLVTGGPGSGKTTIALLKAHQRIERGLLLGQEVLFLSFSRAAVSRAIDASRAAKMPPEVLRQLSIQTYHSFFWEILKAYGYLLGCPRRLRLLPPHDEAVLLGQRERDDPSWLAEREELFMRRGATAFDLFAPKVREILCGSERIRKLVTSRYPLIIVDEAQDTSDDQWAIVKSIADGTQLVCLADLEQQIYDFLPGVSSERVTNIMAALDPIRVDLEGQNHRSPASEIVRFGNDILNRTPRGAPYRGVSRHAFQPKQAQRDKKIRASVGMVSERCRSVTGKPPASIGFLATWGKGVAIVSRALTGDGSNSIRHRVNLDEAPIVLSSRIVAYLLEPRLPAASELGDAGRMLALVGDVFRCKGRKTAAAAADRMAKQATEMQVGKPPRVNSTGAHCVGLVRTLRGAQLTGEPKRDWITIRKTIAACGSDALAEIADHAGELPLFNRGELICTGLTSCWQSHGSYAGAQEVVEHAVAQDQLLSGHVELSGINVMTLHKAKGKEFDAVVILDDAYNSPLVLRGDTGHLPRSRKLLRVGITRARHHVLLLTDVFSPTPLLSGHCL